MKEIGSFLKETRMQNGVSLEEASSDLNITKDELENLEEGNFKAFRDVYDLKIIVREYSKYLGVNPDKALDEFNDFMFEHTSKISLDDIKEARKQAKEMEEKPKIISPYTKIPKKKFSLIKKIKWKRVFQVLMIILAIIIIVLLWNHFAKKDDKVSTELMGRGYNYELTN